jgi:hypothetical protein
VWARKKESVLIWLPASARDQCDSATLRKLENSVNHLIAGLGSCMHADTLLRVPCTFVAQCHRTM